MHLSTLLFVLLVFVLSSSSTTTFIFAIIYPDEARQHFDKIQEEFPTLFSSSTSKPKPTIFSTPPQLDDFPSQHEDNWAVIVSSSKYWHNYRQSNNAFMLYNLLRSNGYPDERIILFVSENHACDRRNPDPGFSSCSRATDFPSSSSFGANVEIDYSGYGADATEFMRILLGTQNAETHPHKTLRSTNKSNVLVYISSHSGEYFTKFQDYEFLSAFELNQIFQIMYRLGKYHRLFFVTDTCKGSTLFDQIDAPNIVSVSSSGPSDDGKAHSEHFNVRASVSAVDAMTSELFDFIAVNNKKDKKTVISSSNSKNNNKEKPTTFREAFDFLVKNEHITSVTSVSHPKGLYQNYRTADILGNGNWLMKDFFHEKSASEEKKPEKKSDTWLNDELEKEFFF